MDKEKTGNDLMRYDLRLQEALRGAVRTIMIDVAKTGFPGDHHFYVSFKTGARGVQLSDRLRKQYPDEMTIVLQHQFWDLVVGDKEFSVGLSFKQIPEKLVIPFNAITSFVDPSVHFALKFEVETGQAAPGPSPVQAVRPPAPQPLVVADRNEPLTDKQRQPRRLTPKAGASGEAPKDAAKDALAGAHKPDAEQALPPAADEKQQPDEEKSKVVSIDAFRKKP